MSTTAPNLQGLANAEAQVWDGSSYYDDAERFLWVFWRETHAFAPLFKRLDTTHLLELACGHGRHSEHVLAQFGDQVQSLVMMDILQSNIDHCSSRIGQRSGVRFIKNDGVSLQPVTDASLTAVFCYDAMVHFHRSVVRAYLQDIRRVLVPGGQALLHHSNYALDPDTSFGTHPSARAFMSAALFSQYAQAAGLEVLEQQIIPWGQRPALDCISLLRRPLAPA